MRILEVCPYSSGGCGVWARAKQESLELAKRGHEVMVFSSNFEKGTDRIVPSEDSIGKIKIRRFKAIKLGGESFMHFNFKEEALKYCPDVIIAHNYRHLHTTQSLKIARILKSMGKKCKVVLVTHAPFVEGNITRTKLQTLIVNLYDSFIGPATLNKFDRILAISKWEIPYLMKCGAERSKIVYIPNGIPDEFFTQKKSREDNKILFLGRISTKKKLDTLVSSIPYLQDRRVKIEVVGPKEEEYFEFINHLIEKLNVQKRIIISDPIYGLKSKISKIDSAKVFVLPSRVEGMPQALIEAMSRGKIAIGSNSIALRDLIIDKKNGYLFEFDNPKDLAAKIDLAMKNNPLNRQIRKNSKEYVKKFRWNVIIKQIEEAIF